jgi:hypothetical protein
MNRPMLYQIRVRGHLSDRRAAWFDGLTIENRPGGEAVLSGPLADQAALHGVLWAGYATWGIAVSRSVEDASHGANC